LAVRESCTPHVLYVSVLKIYQMLVSLSIPHEEKGQGQVGASGEWGKKEVQMSWRVPGL
jgi:hypothetical protein